MNRLELRMEERVLHQQRQLRLLVCEALPVGEQLRQPDSNVQCLKR